ncbi:MAG: hypothetical protein ABI690_14360 [Chloroflexota bacterium]
MLNWNHINKEYVITLSQGKAVIREDATSGNKIYLPRIEDAKGNIIAHFEPGFEDFETADAFVDANLIELDRVDTDETAFRENLISTLAVCIKLLAQPDYVFHRWRLENIQRWLLGRPSNQQMPDAQLKDWGNYVFNWIQAGKSYQCDTPPHGKAIITESAHAASYNIEIENTTGVILKDYFDPLENFSSAEARLRELLSELEQPFVDEVYLDQLIFTLQICQCLMATESDLMQLIRLRFLENYLSEVLP